MACGCNKRKATQTTATLPVVVKQQPAREPSPKPVVIVGDWLCDVCGLLRHRRQKNYRHTCTGEPEERLPFVHRRLEVCVVCPANHHGVCTELIAKRPELDPQILDMTKIGAAICPSGLWPAVKRDCPRCERTNVDLDGVARCKFCNANLFENLEKDLTNG